MNTKSPSVTNAVSTSFLAMKKFTDKRGSKKKKKSKVSRNYSILYVFSTVVVMVVMAAAIYLLLFCYFRGGVGGLGVERRDRLRWVDTGSEFGLC